MTTSLLISPLGMLGISLAGFAIITIIGLLILVCIVVALMLLPSRFVNP